jgi:hypothetical protein
MRWAVEKFKRYANVLRYLEIDLHYVNPIPYYAVQRSRMQIEVLERSSFIRLLNLFSNRLDEIWLL